MDHVNNREQKLTQFGIRTEQKGYRGKSVRTPRGISQEPNRPHEPEGGFQTRCQKGHPRSGFWTRCKKGAIRVTSHQIAPPPPRLAAWPPQPAKESPHLALAWRALWLRVLHSRFDTLLSLRTLFLWLTSLCDGLGFSSHVSATRRWASLVICRPSFLSPMWIYPLKAGLPLAILPSIRLRNLPMFDTSYRGNCAKSFHSSVSMIV